MFYESYKLLLLSVIIKSNLVLDNTTVIYQKLEEFIKKYYTNELIKGSLFFIGLGLLYFLFILLFEYFLWLKPTGRSLLFIVFILVEFFLLLRYILLPVFKLLKFQGGIDYNQASKIIGNHFSDVDDKLTNFLQLANNPFQSELLLASINQKANSLSVVPFTKAVDFSKNKRYLPLAIFPVILFIFFFFSGNSNIITQSLDRVVHFKKQYLPPAPFQFVILNKNLQTQQGDDFILRVKSEGKVVPENVSIFIDGERYFMESSKSGNFEYHFQKLYNSISFHLEANDISSKDYQLTVVAVPSITNFEMLLRFPSYLKKRPELIKGSGNAIIPEGTQVNWKVKALATQNVVFSDYKHIFPFVESNYGFELSKNINQNIEYQIITSNNKIKNFEKLSYQLSVIKDQYPTIEVNHIPDSLKADKSLVIGKISDDYGISKLQIVYYPKDIPTKSKRASLPVKSGVYDQFVFVFPSTLPVEQGVVYNYYFEVFDNDSPHHHKSTKSNVFSDRLSTDDEIQNKVLQLQNDNIEGLQKSLKNQDSQISELNNLQKVTKEKDFLEFNDQRKIDDFIKRQKEQDEIMKEFSRKLNENLEKFNAEKKDSFKEELQKRLENTQNEIEKNKKLLDELKELNDKLKQDELSEKMDKFKQNSKNQVKSLEQLVELTKKFYVEEKTKQLSDKLDKLSDKQDKLSESGKDNSVDKQNKINKEFDEIKNDLNDLEKENKELKSPFDLPNTDSQEKNIDSDLNNAKEELQKSNASKAKPKQKGASKKMKQMSDEMSASMEADEKEQMEEDVAMLRQVLDNLLSFSFSEENLMKQFQGSSKNSPSFNKNLKVQQNLKLQFQHVDDSLFALSLRNPKIGDKITKEIGNVQYNLDKALDSFVESLISKGISHQQYVVAAANKLADLLSDVLNNMQMSLSQSGTGKGKKGQGQDMQLSDIIKKQEGLSDKIKQGMKPVSKPGESKNGKDGNPDSNGKSTDQNGEGNAGEIMEIYKEQKQLRESLQNELNKKGLGGNGQSALDKMKDIEKQLLNKGFKNEVLQKSVNIQQELLKLDKAIKEQGQEEKRQSETANKQFFNQKNTIPSDVKEYLNSIEILNRQSLPLRANYNNKVQEYFNKK